MLKINNSGKKVFYSIILIIFLSITYMGELKIEKSSKNIYPNSAETSIPTIYPETGLKFFDLEGIERTSNKITLGETVIIQIRIVSDCDKAYFYFQTDLLRYTTQPEQMDEFGTEFYRYELNTSNFKGNELSIGLYKFEFVLYNGEEHNEKGDAGYTFENAMEIVNPQNSMLFIIIGIVGGVIILGLALFFIKRRGGEDEFEGASLASTKRREIYTGASQLGKASGLQAESKLAKRQKSSTSSYSTPKTISKKSVPRPISTKSSSSTDIKKLPASLQMKMEESKVDITKKINFTISKVDSLNSQLDLLKTIISVRPDDITCPICKKVIGADWEYCPYCKIQDKDAELGMQISMNRFNTTEKNCKVCGLELKPSWKTCPNCLVKSMK